MIPYQSCRKYVKEGLGEAFTWWMINIENNEAWSYTEITFFIRDLNVSSPYFLSWLCLVLLHFGLDISSKSSSPCLLLFHDDFTTETAIFAGGAHLLLSLLLLAPLEVALSAGNFFVATVTLLGEYATAFFLHSLEAIGHLSTRRLWRTLFRRVFRKIADLFHYPFVILCKVGGNDDEKREESKTTKKVFREIRNLRRILERFWIANPMVGLHLSPHRAFQMS